MFRCFNLDSFAQLNSCFDGCLKVLTLKAELYLHSCLPNSKTIAIFRLLLLVSIFSHQTYQINIGVIERE